VFVRLFTCSLLGIGLSDEQLSVYYERASNSHIPWRRVLFNKVTSHSATREIPHPMNNQTFTERIFTKFGSEELMKFAYA
jgi:hypothetical protein